MGTIVQRGKVFRAVVRMNGVTKTKSCATRQDAKIWTIQTEALLVDKPRINSGTTLGFVFEKAKARDLAKPYPTSGPALFTRLTKTIGHIDLKACDEEFWFDLVRGWASMSPSSRWTLFLRIRGALKYAHRQFKAPVDWAAVNGAQARLFDLEIMADGEDRDRRVSAAEIAALKKAALNIDTIYPHADIIDFALATCLRAGEIFRITWDDLNMEDGKPMLLVRARKHPKKKMKNNQNIPLLGAALAIIKRQPKKKFWDSTEDNRIFPFPSNGYGNAFRRLKAAAKIKGLHFHDLRHEGISRLFEQGFGPVQVCLISGHKSWAALKIYTNLKGSSLHDGPFLAQAQARAA